MRMVSELLLIAGALFPGLTSRQSSAERSENREKIAEKVSFAELGARLGEGNEVLRNLLIDTGHQFNAVDDLKQTFGKLVDPLNNLLTTLEHERAGVASAQGALAAIRTSHDNLRTDFQKLERSAAELKDDNRRLSRELETALKNGRELADERTRLGGELATERATVAALEKQLADEANKSRVLGEEKALLAERTDTADKRIVELETKAAHARERVMLLTNDKDALQAALDKTLVESSRMSRHIADSENIVSELRGKLQQAEAAQAAAEAERSKLVAACDEANELRQSEGYALGLKLDGLRSRAEATEKLLAEARQSLVVRTEDLRAAEGRLQEATAGKREAEKMAATHSVSSDRWQSQVKKLERSVEGLTERCKVLSEVLASREGSLAHANERTSVLSDEIQRLQQEAAAARAGAEEEVVKLNADIQQERAERAVLEGSLETARGDYARILRQFADERAAWRRDQHTRGKADPGTPA